ncbi:cytochrome [Sesamum alatum]|uniref:Cytochrome n=1 Tax=Sesamum alatum TaxID=300844 RepID=A0AAE1Z3A1_9LAMI|nr:cytochrome [Sesamum alatum]
MAFEAFFTWLLQLSFGFSFFTFTAFFFIFSILGFLIKLKPWCSCEICQSFLTSSWTLEYNNLCDWYSHLLSKSPTGTIHVHVLGNVITANPENVEHMLKTRFENYPKGKPFSAILGDLLGRGIFNADGDLWRFQRKMASLELGSVSVRSYAFNIVTTEIESRLIPLLSSVANKDIHGSSGSLDLQDIFRRFSFDSICRFSFGLDPGCLRLSLPISEFASAFDLASKLSAERAITTSPMIWKLKRFFNLGSEKQLKQAIKSVHELAEEVIRHKRNNVVHDSPRDDLLSRFICTTDDDVFLRDIVVSFLLAGRDTVASALTSFFWILSKNTHVVEKIREESDRVMGQEPEKMVEFAQLREMHYLQAAVHESMRLFPPVQFDSKFCEEDDVLADGTFVTGGTRVTYHPYAMGRMERIWGPDCLEFKPERWLRGGVFKQEDPFKYPVFQAGRRVCLGKEMAVVEMKTVALSLIRRFDIQVAMPGRAPIFMPGLTATLRGGLPIVVRERKL